MATRNFFDLLGDDEHEDPAQVVVRASPEEVKPAAGEAKKPAAAAKLRTKPATTNEAGRDGQRGEYDGGRGGRGGRGGGRGGRGNYGDYREGGFGFPREEASYRDRSYYNNDRSGSNNTRDADGFVDKPVRTGNGESRSASYDGGRGGGGRGRGRGGRGYGEGDYRPRRREFDELSGNPRNMTEKRAGAGRGGNWETDPESSLIQGTPEAAKEEDKPAVGGETVEINRDIIPKTTVEEGAAEPVKEEEEDNEMTLEEYEKALEEKRKALEGEKAAERKVEVDKAFETMQLVDNKKRDEDFFIKLGQEKEKEKEKGKREVAEREDKSRKPVSINEFLKPAEGEKYYGHPSSRGRGGRGGRGERREGGGRGERESNPNRGSFGGGRFGGGGRGAAAPKIEDQNQFPTLGGK